MLSKLKLLFPKKGSVLVFSLIILAFMLVSALSVAVISVTEKRASLATDKSSRAFQVADTGVEVVLEKIYKGNFGSLSDLGDSLGGDCNTTTNEIEDSVGSGNYRVSFLDSTGTKISCSDTEWRSKVSKIKSEGTAGNTRRAVEVAVAAVGDYQLSCFSPASGEAMCCRINTDSGNVTCQRIIISGGSWGNASDPDNSSW